MEYSNIERPNMLTPLHGLLFPRDILFAPSHNTLNAINFHLQDINFLLATNITNK